MRKYLVFSVLLAAAAIYMTGCNQAQGTQELRRRSPSLFFPSLPLRQLPIRSSQPQWKAR